MSTNHSSEGTESSPLLIEFVSSQESDDLQQVGIFDRLKANKVELENKSNAAMDKAMKTIQKMAVRVVSTIEEIERPPGRMQMEFGIKFDAELDAIIAKVGTEASISVIMEWKFEGGNS